MDSDRELIQLELKYCERCGGLWFRMQCSPEVYCATCAIAMADVAAKPILVRGLVLAVVGIALTVGVYGAVALIVKMDDVGLHLARGRNGIFRAVGRWMVQAMPLVMGALSAIGTIAMSYVGGGIILHGLEAFGWQSPAHAIRRVANGIAAAAPFVGALLAWLFTALCAAIAGFMIGGVLLIAANLVGRAVATMRGAR